MAGSDLYTGTTGLRELVQEAPDGTTAVRLLRGKWLAERGYTRPQQLPLRQQLEKSHREAFADIDLLNMCLAEVGTVTQDYKMSYPGVLVLSYCWESPEHPDPRGTLLEKLAPILEWYASERAHVGLNPDFCVFVDFWSLYQGDERTEAELAAFRRALHRMDEWYGHVGTVTLCMTALPADWKVARTYDSRGWCFFEVMVSSLGKKATHCLNAGGFDLCFHGDLASKSDKELAAQGKGDVHALQGILKKMVQGFRRAPATPEVFGQLLCKTEFTKETDRPVVQELYTRVATAILGSVESMSYSAITWGTDDFGRLSRVLGMCGRLKTLELIAVGMTAKGAEVIAAGIATNKTLKELK